MARPTPLSPVDRLTVLHVAAPAAFGGLESVVRMLAAGHRARGHEVHVAAVLSPGEAPHPFLDALARDGTPATAVRVRDRDYLGERSAIARLARAVGAGVLHTHGFRPDVVDASVARRLGLRLVSTTHGFIGGTARSRVYEWLQVRSLRGHDAIAAVSTVIEERLIAAGVRRDRVHLLPNAYLPRPHLPSQAASRAHLGLPVEAPVIGWVGRLDTEKGADVALRAFARCPEPGALLALVGAGRELDMLRSLATSLGIGERVRFLGAVADAGNWFPAFDVFLLSSRTEGTPVALLEAMAAGVPIVATSVGGVPDVLSDAEGWLAPSENAEALGAALFECLSDRAMAQTRAAAARTRLDQQFALEPWLARYERLYRPSFD